MLCTLACPILSLLLHSAGMKLVLISIATKVQAESADAPLVPLVVNEAPATENESLLGPSTAASSFQLSMPRPPSNAVQSLGAVVPQEPGNAAWDTANPSHLVHPWFLYALLVWAAGCAWLLASLARSWFKLQQIVRRASPIADRRVHRTIRDCRSELRCRRRVRVLMSSDVNCPLAAGCRRPVILLPQGVCSLLADTDLRAILLHELAHVARHDHAALMIEAVFAAVYWPHPLFHFLRRGLSRAREEVCDNYVVRRMDRRAYSELLLRLARTWPPRPLAGAGVGLFSTRWRLESRVAALLDERRRTMVRTNRLTNLSMAAAMLAIVLGIGVTQVVAEREESQDDAIEANNGLDDDRAARTGADRATAAYTDDEPTAQRRRDASYVVDVPDPRARPSYSYYFTVDDQRARKEAIPNGSGGQRIALVNIPRIFKELPKFQDDIESLQKEMTAHDAQMEERRKEIAALERAGIPKNQSAKALVDELIIDRKADFTVSAEKAQKWFMAREAEAYRAAYALIQDEIGDYADEHDIDIVLRDTSELPSKRAIQGDDDAGSASKVPRREIIAQINQDVVFIRDERIDITDAIIKRLRERAAEERTRR
jgi:beta-lactamase regulating signal transducer with metallopeptidase domain/Skp family chaperone for outer membrane proteins